MDAEERTQNAITITRGVLKQALDSPFTMAVMTKDCTNPDHIEYQVEMILCYLEKTAPKKPETSISSWDQAPLTQLTYDEALDDIMAVLDQVPKDLRRELIETFFQEAEASR